MKNASIAEAKAQLSSLIAQVRNGEEVVLTDRGRPVARLVPIDPDLDQATLTMVKLGLVRLPLAPHRLPKPRVIASSETTWIDREDRF